MKKLILLLVPIFFLQSVAFAGSATGLKALVDDYRYSLTVEWDQKDKSVLEAIQTRFHQDLNVLQASQRLSVSDLRETFAQAGSQDQELEFILNQRDEAAMASELQKLIDARSEAMYSRGASWSPGGIFWTGIGILFVLEIIVLAMRDSDCPNSINYPEGVRYKCEW